MLSPLRDNTYAMKIQEVAPKPPYTDIIYVMEREVQESKPPDPVLNRGLDEREVMEPLCTSLIYAF